MKVYAVIEEYDPYVSYPDIESRAELRIHGIYRKLERAIDVRNDLVREEAREYNVKVDKEFYDDPDRTIDILGSEFYIQEFEAE